MQARAAAGATAQAKRKLERMIARQSKRRPPPLPAPPTDIIAFATIELGGAPDPWQAEYLMAIFDSTRIAIVASRQAGKSAVTGIAVAFLLLHLAHFEVIILSRTLRQASAFMRKVRRAVLRYVPRRRMEQVNALSLVLPNGSLAATVPCENPDAARGYSPDLLIIDEAAFIADAAFEAVTPSLAATHGAMHLISSANGPSGYFYRACESDLSTVYWVRKVVATECPRITAEFLEQERLALGEDRFNQEYFCLFLEMEGAFFRRAQAEIAAMGEDREDEAFPQDTYQDLPGLEDIKEAFDARDRLVRRLVED